MGNLCERTRELETTLPDDCFMIFKSRNSWKNLGSPRSLRARIFQTKQKDRPKYSPSFLRNVNALKGKWKTFVPLLYIKREPALSLIVIEYCILSTLHNDSSSRFEICYEYLISPRIEEKEKKEKKKLLQERST